MRPLIAPHSNLAAPSAGSNPKQNLAKINQCAKEFEGMLLEQMLRSARESGGGGLTGDGEDDDANSTMLEMGEQQFAQALASSGALGIGKMVIAGLTKNADR